LDMASDKFDMPNAKKLEVIVSSLEGVEKKSGKLVNLRVNLKTVRGEIYSILVDLKSRRFFVGDKYTAELKMKASPDFLGDNVKNMRIATCSYRITSLKTKKDEEVYRELEN